jgi:uncharacterized surface protein with fasciclin (FAS1) repeats
MAGALKGDGPLTVFAPTDAAFAKLPEGTVNSLLGDIPALTNILTYHVAAGEVSPRKLLARGTITTLQGTAVEITHRGGALFANDSKILDVIYVRNGVIYVVDSVLLPR